MQLLESIPPFDPHSMLGLHDTNDGKKCVRLFRPLAPYVYLELFGERVEAKPNGEEGLYECEVPLETTFADYKVYSNSGELAHDPYAFLPTFGSMDAHLFNRGVHYKLYEVMGAHLCVHQGVEGAKFALWAPHAHSVSVVGDFNLWNGRVHPMRSMGESGVWELFIPGLSSLEKYKFEIHTKEGHTSLKSDPFAQYSEMRSKNASILFDVDRFEWRDHHWMQTRAQTQKESAPLLIYEVHLGSWKKKGERFLNYREIAVELAAYCQSMGFTHVELLPIMEHPLDESWGYQVTGFFSATSRFGTPEDFQFFVDHLHTEGIGVILDWVPAHFPLDGHGLAQFDGSYLYEHADPRQGFHPHWNTCIFNYGRPEVSNFLIASAFFWLDKMHVDGLRVDAVASMLYLDYGREPGQWIPNKEGHHLNLEAIEWMKHFNTIAEERFPGVLRIAEESTSFSGVSRRVENGGLGFNMKWSLGWMNDTLRYFSKDPLFRPYHQGDLTFFLLYAYSERFVLPLSHDEVVHGKASLLSKMRGDDWQKFAGLRLLYSYQICQPGKKLLFMGAELGQWEEWNCKQELPWDLLSHDRHQQLHTFFKEMNHFYLSESALWESDFEHEGFEWVDCSDKENCVISYLRKSAESELLIVHNFTPNAHLNYCLSLPHVQDVQEVFNTDRKEYFGSDKTTACVKLTKESARKVQLEFVLAPLATMIFKVHSSEGN